MSVTASSVCERFRSQISLELDDPLSELERRMLAAHLVHCDECRAFAADVGAYTRALREAPLEPLQRPVVVRRSRRWALEQIQWSAAAVVAIASLGIASQLVPSQSGGTAGVDSVSNSAHYQTRLELDRELAIIELVRDRTASFPSASVL